MAFESAGAAELNRWQFLFGGAHRTKGRTTSRTPYSGPLRRRRKCCHSHPVASVCTRARTLLVIGSVSLGAYHVIAAGRWRRSSSLPPS